MEFMEILVDIRGETQSKHLHNSHGYTSWHCVKKQQFRLERTQKSLAEKSTNRSYKIATTIGRSS